MRVLLDECLPRKLKSLLPEHDVATVPDAGWAGRKNGELLKLAATKFDVFVTADQVLTFHFCNHRANSTLASNNELK